MKKLFYGSLAFLVLFTVFACVVLSTPSKVLYLLNWGEYISEELVQEFESEYQCQVIEETVTSSEAMYQKITSKTTTYDVAIPSDYTVHQLYKEDMLLPFDVDNKDYENLSSYLDIFQDDLSSLMETYMVEDGKKFNSYFMPYFWGSYSMLYSKNNPEVEKVISRYGFQALYERNLCSSSIRSGMYSTARWILTSYLLSRGLDPNITSYDGSKDGDLSDEIKNDAIAALKKAKFDEFGDDSLKRNVANGSLDLCFTQSGDFFDALYLMYDSDDKPISFSINVPKSTAAFFDSMVIPKTAQNYDLANAFVNFMLDGDNAYENARAIGYSPTLKSVCSLFHENAKKGEYYYQDEERNRSLSLSDFLSSYPNYLDPLCYSDKVYLLEPKSNAYLTTCETIFNNLA